MVGRVGRVVVKSMLRAQAWPPILSSNNITITLNVSTPPILWPWRYFGLEMIFKTDSTSDFLVKNFFSGKHGEPDVHFPHHLDLICLKLLVYSKLRAGSERTVHLCRHCVCANFTMLYTENVSCPL